MFVALTKASNSKESELHLSSNSKVLSSGAVLLPKSVKVKVSNNIII